MTNTTEEIEKLFFEQIRKLTLYGDVRARN